MVSTQLRALSGIIALSTRNPAVYQYFKTHEADKAIMATLSDLLCLHGRCTSHFSEWTLDCTESGLDGCDSLLFAARTALICFEDSELSRAGQRLVSFPHQVCSECSKGRGSLVLEWMHEWNQYGAVLLKYLW